MAAAEGKILRTMIVTPANPNLEDYKNDGPLQVAAEMGQQIGIMDNNGKLLLSHLKVDGTWDDWKPSADERADLMRLDTLVTPDHMANKLQKDRPEFVLQFKQFGNRIIYDDPQEALLGQATIYTASLSEQQLEELKTTLGEQAYTALMRQVRILRAVVRQVRMHYANGEQILREDTHDMQDSKGDIIQGTHYRILKFGKFSYVPLSYRSRGCETCQVVLIESY